MIGSNVITLPSQKAQAAERPPVGNHQDRSDLNRRTLGSRSLSWAPDRRVSFCERAGGCTMEAAPVSKLEESHLFFRHNPDLDLRRLLGVRRGASTPEVLKAFRMKARSYHPDKLSHLPTEEQEEKSEEFKRMSTARDILSDPLMAEQFLQWQAERAAELARARAKAAAAARATPAPARPRATRAYDPRNNEDEGQARGCYAQQARKEPSPFIFGKLETSLSRGPPLHHQVRRPSLSRPSLSQHPRGAAKTSRLHATSTR